jgi:hypothetical protein
MLSTREVGGEREGRNRHRKTDNRCKHSVEGNKDRDEKE